MPTNSALRTVCGRASAPLLTPFPECPFTARAASGALAATGACAASGALRSPTRPPRRESARARCSRKISAAYRTRSSVLSNPRWLAFADVRCLYAPPRRSAAGNASNAARTRDRSPKAAREQTPARTAARAARPTPLRARSAPDSQDIQIDHAGPPAKRGRPPELTLNRLEPRQQLPRRRARLEQRRRIHKRRLLQHPPRCTPIQTRPRHHDPEPPKRPDARSTFATGSPTFDPIPIPARTERAPAFTPRTRRTVTEGVAPSSKRGLATVTVPRHPLVYQAHPRQHHPPTARATHTTAPAPPPKPAHARPHNRAYQPTNRSDAPAPNPPQARHPHQKPADDPARPGAPHAAPPPESRAPPPDRSSRTSPRFARRAAGRDSLARGHPSFSRSPGRARAKSG